MDKKYINIKDAALMLGVSKLTLRNWDKEGKLVAFRHPINNYRVYKIEDLEGIIRTMESGEKPFRARAEKKVIHSSPIPTPEKQKTFKIKVVSVKD